MININLSQTAFMPLDEEEAKLMESIEQGHLVPVSKSEDKKLKNIFSHAKTSGPIKTKPISLRLKEPTILSLKNKSAKSGVPYQTILSALADQYASGRIKLGI